VCEDIDPGSIRRLTRKKLTCCCRCLIFSPFFQVAEQRKQYKLLADGKPSSITPHRVDQLNELDFAWNAQDYAWDRHKKDLETYRAAHGHCHVPLNYELSPKLGLWVKEQRRHYSLMQQGKPSHMTKSRAVLLDAMGFVWDTHEATWLERFRELKQFKVDHGHVNVPTNYSPNAKLGTWAHHQRRQYRKWKNDQPNHITNERVDLLESIGFVWSPRQQEDHDHNDDNDDDDDDDGDNDNDNESTSVESSGGDQEEGIIEPTPMYFGSHTMMERRLREARTAKRRKTTGV
jgi:hypothetical protein